VRGRRGRLALAGLSAFAAAACSSGSSSGERSDRPPPAAGPGAARESAGVGATGAGSAGGGSSAASAASACPHDGRWRACTVAERLDQAGLVPRPDSGPALRVPFLTGRDTVVRLGRGALHAFVYDDTVRLAREVAALDTARVAPRGGAFDWGDVPPTLVRSANLVAVLLIANEHQLERVQLALSAGPPQRNPDRP
jgi:hypothetical protein